MFECSRKAWKHLLLRALGRSNLVILILIDVTKAQAPGFLHEVENEAVEPGSAL